MAKTYGPYSTLHSKKDHYIDTKLYTPFTIYVVSNDFNGGLAKSYGPYSILHSMKDHYNDTELYTP